MGEHDERWATPTQYGGTQGGDRAADRQAADVHRFLRDRTRPARQGEAFSLTREGYGRSVPAEQHSLPNRQDGTGERIRTRDFVPVVGVGSARVRDRLPGRPRLARPGLSRSPLRVPRRAAQGGLLTGPAPRTVGGVTIAPASPVALGHRFATNCPSWPYPGRPLGRRPAVAGAQRAAGATARPRSRLAARVDGRRFLVGNLRAQRRDRRWRRVTPGTSSASTRRGWATGAPCCSVNSPAPTDACATCT